MNLHTIVFDDKKLAEYKNRISKGMYAQIYLHKDTKLWLEDGQKLTLQAGHQAFQATDIIRLNNSGDCAVVLAIDGRNRYTNRVESAKITVSLDFIEDLFYIH